MKPATLTPDEIIGQPGMIEASAIEFDNEQAMKGLRHYVLMGLRLMDVKARLSHGQFIPWLEKYLPHISKPHLHRAKSIAEGLCEITGIKFITRDKFDAFKDTLPPELESIVAGASGVRALLAEIQEFRQDSDEEAARAKCEEMFADDPELRDEWEPRALSGELPWTLVFWGMKGQAATKEKNRAEPNYTHLIPKSFVTLRNGFEKWSEFDEKARDQVVIEAKKLVSVMPPEVRAALGIPQKGGQR